MGALQGNLDEALCYPVVVVAEDVAFVGEGSRNGLNAEGANAVEIGFDGALAFAGVALENHGRDRRGVDKGVVEDRVPTVALAVCGGSAVLQDLFDVLGGGEPEGLVGLGHEIADVDARGLGGGDGLGDAADEEVGDERGVERTGAEGDEVGVGDGGERFGQGLGACGVEHELVNAEVAFGDVGLAAHNGAVFHEGGEGDVGRGGRIDAAPGGEDLGGGLNGLGEVAGDVGERGEEEIAEGVAFEVALFEAVLEEAGEEVLVFGEGDHAVTDVAGRKHLEVFAEAAGGAAVVCDRDDRGEVADHAGVVGGRKVAIGRVGKSGARGGVDGAAGDGCWDVMLEAAKQGG